MVQAMVRVEMIVSMNHNTSYRELVHMRPVAYPSFDPSQYKES